MSNQTGPIQKHIQQQDSKPPMIKSLIDRFMLNKKATEEAKKNSGRKRKHQNKTKRVVEEEVNILNQQSSDGAPSSDLEQPSQQREATLKETPLPYEPATATAMIGPPATSTAHLKPSDPKQASQQQQEAMTKETALPGDNDPHPGSALNATSATTPVTVATTASTPPAASPSQNMERIERTELIALLEQASNLSHLMIPRQLLQHIQHQASIQSTTEKYVSSPCSPYKRRFGKQRYIVIDRIQFDDDASETENVEMNDNTDANNTNKDPYSRNSNVLLEKDQKGVNNLEDEQDEPLRKRMKKTPQGEAKQTPTTATSNTDEEPESINPADPRRRVTPLHGTTRRRLSLDDDDEALPLAGGTVSETSDKKISDTEQTDESDPKDDDYESSTSSSSESMPTSTERAHSLSSLSTTRQSPSARLTKTKEKPHATSSPKQSPRHEEEEEGKEEMKMSAASCAKPPQRKAQKKSTEVSRLLETYMTPGIHDVCHKPKKFVIPNVSGQVREAVAQEMLKELYGTQTLHPHVAKEMPHSVTSLSNQCESTAATSTTSKTDATTNVESSRLDVPERLEKGYYKSHLKASFVESLQDALPDCIRIKSTVSRKGIGFISTTSATQSPTHFDQDTSFLYVLTGKKEIYFSHPTMREYLRREHLVISHTSIFENVNPFVAAYGNWEFVVLEAGEGLLLPKDWIHAVKSEKGTVAVSFQVESSGKTEATSPYVRRRRNAEEIVISSSIELDEDEGEEDNDKEEEDDDKDDDDDDTGKGLEEDDSDEEVEEDGDDKEEDSDDEEDSDEEEYANLTTLQLHRSSGRKLPKAMVVPTKVVAPAFSRMLRKRTETSAPEPPKPMDISTKGVASSIQSRTTWQRSKREPQKPVILPTKVAVPTSYSPPHPGARRSTREKKCCGVAGCNNPAFPDGLMWVMIAELSQPHPRRLPTIPSYHPKHLICTDCRPILKQKCFHPEEVLTEDDKKEIPGWDKYRYYSASRKDYECRLHN